MSRGTNDDRCDPLPLGKAVESDRSLTLHGAKPSLSDKPRLRAIAVVYAREPAAA